MAVVSLFSHQGNYIRKGYANSNSFKDTQILIRLSASNNKLVISTRPTSSDRWNYIETLNFPLNPSDMIKFGQKKQPFKSSSNNVVFTFVNAKKYYRSIPESNIDPLVNSFQPAKNGGSSMPAPSGSKATTPTRNRFEVLSEN